VLNCGKCDLQCQSGESCTAGKCTCDGGARCTGSAQCCKGQGCIDVSVSSVHCGSCTAPGCPAGYFCGGGLCQPTPCVPPCINGNQCNLGVCQCNGSTPCGGAQYCCAGGCATLASDPNNCNACSYGCGGANLCCNGTCTNPADPNNCGGCGVVCPGTYPCVLSGATWYCMPN
jgi:hypothetical protein